jgi:hypothetical protein
MDALKKVDWVLETFPDYCRENPDVVLMDKAMCFEAVGDKNEAKKFLEQMSLLIKENPKYRGYSQMVNDKLNEYRQDEESRERMKAVAEEAMKNPYGLSDEDLEIFSKIP